MRVRTHAHSDARPPQRAAIRRRAVSVPPRALSPARNCTALRRPGCAACVKSARERRGARRPQPRRGRSRRAAPAGDPHSAASHSQTLSRARRPHTQGALPTRARETTLVLTTFTSASANFFHEFPEHLQHQDLLRAVGLILQR